MKRRTILLICVFIGVFIFSCSLSDFSEGYAGQKSLNNGLYAKEIRESDDARCMISPCEMKFIYPESIELEKIWETSNELLTSESVFYDGKREVLYVSCINGIPGEKDGNGYIARVSLDGTILNKEWVTGLNAPKGMGLYKNSLFVSDIDQIVEIDVNRGNILNKYDVQGALFLNDIAIDSRGTVYSSDSNATTIYSLSNGVTGVWLSGMENKPNGLLISHDFLYAGIKKNILKIGLADKVIYEKLTVASSQIDGLKKYNHDMFLISDWNGKTQVVNNEASKVLLDTTGTGVNSADFEFIKEKSLLIIPTFSGNTAAAYKVNILKGPFLRKKWSSANDLLTSESVFYDRQREVLYVSCINGIPGEKDGNGYIARVSLDGTILNKEWVTGLNAPKGMGLYRDRLFVSDIDQIAEIDVNSGNILNKYDVQGALFLNDIAIDSRGTVYSSDSNATTIYSLSNGVTGVWLSGMENKPNGLLISHDFLYAGIKKNILKIGLADKVIYEKLTAASSQIDGLKKYKNDSFFISDWTGKTQLVSADASKVLLDTTGTGINSADFEYIREKRFLIIPTFAGNNITTYEVLD